MMSTAAIAQDWQLLPCDFAWRHKMLHHVAPVLHAPLSRSALLHNHVAERADIAMDQSSMTMVAGGDKRQEAKHAAATGICHTSNDQAR